MDDARRARDGDIDILDRLAADLRSLALHVATAVLGSAEAASDVVTSVAVRARLGVRELDDPFAFRAWYLARVVDAAVAAPDVPVLSSVGRRFVAATDARLAQVERTAIAQISNNLPVRERVTLALRYDERFDEAEIADVLHRSVSLRPRRPATADGGVRGPLASRLAAAVVCGALFVGVAGPLRERVADWLGGGSDLVPVEADSVPVESLDVDAFSADDALAAEPWLARLSRSARLGVADRYGRASDGGIVAVWDEGRVTVWVGDAGATAQTQVQTIVDTVRGATPLAGVGDLAVVVVGADAPVHRNLQADVTVVWADGSRVIRLDTDTTPERATAIARELAG